MSTANADIRARIQEKGFFYWQVADAIGISYSLLSCWLRKPLTGTRRERVLTAIDRLVGEKAVNAP